MVDELGGSEPVPRLTPRAPGQSCYFPHCLQVPGSARTELILAAGRRRCGAWGASLGRLGSISGASEEGSPQGAGRRLAVPGSQVQLSSILGDNIYNVPSPRIIPPACPPSVFPADGFSRLLNNWLGSGAPWLPDCCPSGPSPFSRVPKALG